MRHQPRSQPFEPDDAPAAQTAKHHCGEVLEFTTNGHGVLLEICPACDRGAPRKAKRALTVHYCRRCTTAPVDDAGEVCNRCRPRERVWMACEDCGANAKQSRCGRCRAVYQRARQRQNEAERRRRVREYQARAEGN